MSEWESIIGSKKGSSYGTCVMSMKQSTAQYVKHYLDKSDTLQGLALKYDSSTDELRRINRLYSSDSIFLRQYLLVPAPKVFPISGPENAGVPQLNNVSDEPPERDVDALSFLKQLDSKISAGKNAIKDFKYNNNPISTEEARASALYLRTSDYLKPNSNGSKDFSHSQNVEGNIFQL